MFLAYVWPFPTWPPWPFEAATLGRGPQGKQGTRRMTCQKGITVATKWNMTQLYNLCFMSLLLNVLVRFVFFFNGSQVNGCCHVPPCHQAQLVRPHPTDGFCFTSPFVWLTPILSLFDTLDLLILGLLKPATAVRKHLCVKTPGSHRRRLTAWLSWGGNFPYPGRRSLREGSFPGGVFGTRWPGSTWINSGMSGNPSFLTNGPWGDFQVGNATLPGSGMSLLMALTRGAYHRKQKGLNCWSDTSGSNWVKHWTGKLGKLWKTGIMIIIHINPQSKMTHLGVFVVSKKGSAPFLALWPDPKLVTRPFHRLGKEQMDQIETLCCEHEHDVGGQTMLLVHLGRNGGVLDIRDGLTQMGILTLHIERTSTIIDVREFREPEWNARRRETTWRLERA